MTGSGMIEAMAVGQPPRADETVLLTLGRLTRGALHELANPLLALTGSAELAFAEVEPGSKLHDRLEAVRDMGAELTEIVRALQAFARLQSEPAARLSLADAAENAVRLVRRVGAIRGVELSVRREAEPYVVAPPGLVGARLVELLLDGVGGPERGDAVELVVAADGGEAVATVSGAASSLRLPAEAPA